MRMLRAPAFRLRWSPFFSHHHFIWNLRLLPVKLRSGGVGEWLKPAVLKTVRPERVSGVRIPPPPPHSHAFSPSLFRSSRKPQIAVHLAQMSRTLEPIRSVGYTADKA